MTQANCVFFNSLPSPIFLPYPSGTPAGNGNGFAERIFASSRFNKLVLLKI